MWVILLWVWIIGSVVALFIATVWTLAKYRTQDDIMIESKGDVFMYVTLFALGCWLWPAALVLLFFIKAAAKLLNKIDRAAAQRRDPMI